MGSLVFVDGSVNSERYIQILADHFQPWLLNLQAKENRTFIFQEDGATCHTAAATRAWKTRHMISGFEFWPAQSPDLNPIEHLWWALESRIESRRHTIQNAAQLKELLLEAWNEISHDLFIRLVDSMKDRC